MWLFKNQIYFHVPFIYIANAIKVMNLYIREKRKMAAICCLIKYMMQMSVLSMYYGFHYDDFNLNG